MKRALIVGVNYYGTPHELRGCINDAHNIHQFLMNVRAFDEAKVLLEKQATTQGILDGLRWLVNGAAPGDVLFFHYSGHGSQVRSNIEPDGLDEIICPIDLDWKDHVIRDDDMKAILGQVPNGVNITVFLDCCHSGTALDSEQSLYAEANVVLNQEDYKRAGSRFMPMPGDVQGYIQDEGLQIREFVTSRDINRSALLVAGCAAHQTSADAYLDSQHQGAATFALMLALKSGKKTYREIVESMNRFMTFNSFTQQPQLDGHPSLYDQAFLEPWGTLDGQPTETPPPGTWSQPVAVAPSDEVSVVDEAKKIDLPMVLAIMSIVTAIAVYLWIM